MSSRCDGCARFSVFAFFFGGFEVEPVCDVAGVVGGGPCRGVAAADGGGGGPGSVVAEVVADDVVAVALGAEMLGDDRVETAVAFARVNVAFVDVSTRRACAVIIDASAVTFFAKSVKAHAVSSPLATFIASVPAAIDCNARTYASVKSLVVYGTCPCDGAHDVCGGGEGGGGAAGTASAACASESADASTRR